MDSANQPFWKDEPEVRVQFPQPLKSLFRVYGIILQVMIVFLPAVMFWFVSPTWTFIWLGFFILMYGLSFYRIRHRKAALDHTQEIQKSALEKVGTSQMGSAIHVAGHPLLQRDQPVVLALIEEQLNIYSYDNSIPLDSISLKNIKSLHTVVYDDDRVPHIDVIDSAAQALQITFNWREQPCTCLFHRMRKMKAIDWYHAIQQNRLQVGLAT